MPAMMDDTAKKLIAQLGDPMPGQRGNALEMLYPHMEKNGWTFHGWIADLEEAAKNKADADALRQDNAKLTADLSQWKGAVGKWQKAHDDLKRQLAMSQGIEWLRKHGRRILAGLAVPVIALIGWQGYQRWVWPAEVDNGLHQLAMRTPWRQGYGEPFVRVIAGNPYWVLIFGDSDRSGHVTAQGGPVGMNCVHVYAEPAEADFGEYVKASPFAMGGWWRKWPQRAVDCRPFSLSAGLASDAPSYRPGDVSRLDRSTTTAR
jgi:hypothetical protein